MKKLFLVIFLFFMTSSIQAEVLQAGVLIEQIPKALYGSWRVNAKLEETNSPTTFKPQSLDFWNLSRLGDVVKLDNPFSGAKAEIAIQTVEGNIIVFSKKLPYDGNKILTDTVTLRLERNSFTGINTLQLESYSLVDKHLMKTETATYKISGEKISGDNVLLED